MIPTEGASGLPRPLRQLLNLLRRFPLLSIVLGERPIEPAVRRLYSEFIDHEDVVVEVGARMGDGTRTLARIAKQVYSFEPSQTNFALLKALTRTHHNNVEIYKLALSDHTGDDFLYRDRNFSGVASLKKISDVKYVSREKVALGTLDGIRFKLPPTAMVVDCEGSEYEVLKGAQTLLPHLRSVLVETHILSDGSSTTDSVQGELSRFFPSIRVDRVGNECWVIARR